MSDLDITPLNLAWAAAAQSDDDPNALPLNVVAWVEHWVQVCLIF